ncbi:hypothetical protein JGS22_000210 [Streptomyces sp. P38-E01]|uniref:Lipoprotein n=1 Tax=Streptomyces tardus TaxID=2780544 RepID=A0A949JKZ9_9ACTN|nr:hypothetical protein [Streptomyces tardus]MBU7596095.1 hypothetical protein [Streptomyces tardus]
MSPTPQRRTFVTAGAAGAVALLATACTGGGADEPPSAPKASPAEEVRGEAARQSRELLERYDATVRAHPSLAEPLAPLRAAVARHLAEFDGRSGRRQPDTERREKADSAAAGARKVPGEPRAALAALAKAERRTVDARTKALDTAPPQAAMVLASVAAAGAAHGYLLTELRAEVD